jgi:Flp pilus assembly CpaE family ATPase
MPPVPFFRRGGGKAADALDRSPFLALLEPDLRQRLRKRLTRRKIGVGKQLFRPGDTADALYLVESGRFRLFMSGPGGTERVMQFVEAGEVIGEAAFIADAPYVTGAVAIEDAAVVRLDRADFDALLGQQPAVLHYLAALIAARQERANARLAAESTSDDARAQRGYVTSVYSPRGGAGVTTVALNVAIAMAERHPDDAVLLDLDVLFGHALTNVWLEPRGVLAQISPATMRGLDRPGLEHYLSRHASSLRIFPAATRPEEGQAIGDDLVRATLTTLRRHFGHILVDLPHAFNEVTLAGLEASDQILVLATAEPITLHDVLETRRILLDVLGLPPERIRYVLNRPQPYSEIEVSELSAATGTSWAEIGYGGEAPANAAVRGESLLDTRPGNAVSRGAVLLTEEITARAREVAALAGRAV